MAQFVGIKLLIPSLVKDWIDQRAQAEQMTSEQFLNALLIAVRYNFILNQNQSNETQTPQLQEEAR